MVGILRDFFDEHPRAEWLIPAVLCIAMLLQVLLSVRQMSQHADEATHIYAGYRILKCGDYSFGREHPPFAKIVAAAPLLWSQPPVQCVQPSVPTDDEADATEWLYAQPDWWNILMRARIAMTITLLGLLLVIWLIARQFFGLGAAIVSTTLFAFEPNFVGNGGLVLNNVLLSLLFLLTIYGFYLWTEQRHSFLLFGTGLAFGLALLTKHSAAFLAFVLLILALLEPWLPTREGRRQRAAENLLGLLLVGVVAFITIWGMYGFRYSQTGRRFVDVVRAQQLSASHTPGAVVLLVMRSAHLLPQAYLDGILEAGGLVHDSGTGSVVLGHHYDRAPWFTFPVTFLIKLTLGSLAICLAGLLATPTLLRDHRKALTFFLVPAVLYLAIAFSVPRFSGIWHLFPALPFVFIVASAAVMVVADRNRWSLVLLAAFLFAHVGSSLHGYPHYLSYSNEAAGGPAKLYHLLPMTDLGQTFFEVSRYLEKHPGQPCWMDVDWSVPADKYGIPCTQMGNHWTADLPPRLHGIVFLSSTWLQIDGNPGDPLEPFRNVQPAALLGGSAMLVYEGDFDSHLLAARALEMNSSMRYEHNDLEGALIYSRRAVEVAPDSGRAHHYYCVMLAQNGYLMQGYTECSLGLQLAAPYPILHEESDLMRKRIATLGQYLGIPEDSRSN